MIKEINSVAYLQHYGQLIFHITGSDDPDGSIFFQHALKGLCLGLRAMGVPVTPPGDPASVSSPPRGTPPPSRVSARISVAVPSPKTPGADEGSPASARGGGSRITVPVDSLRSARLRSATVDSASAAYSTSSFHRPLNSRNSSLPRNESLRMGTGMDVGMGMGMGMGSPEAATSSSKSPLSRHGSASPAQRKERVRRLGSVDMEVKVRRAPLDGKQLLDEEGHTDEDEDGEVRIGDTEVATDHEDGDTVQLADLRALSLPELLDQCRLLIEEAEQASRSQAIPVSTLRAGAGEVEEGSVGALKLPDGRRGSKSSVATRLTAATARGGGKGDSVEVTTVEADVNSANQLKAVKLSSAQVMEAALRMSYGIDSMIHLEAPKVAHEDLTTGGGRSSLAAAPRPGLSTGGFSYTAGFLDWAPTDRQTSRAEEDQEEEEKKDLLGEERNM